MRAYGLDVVRGLAIVLVLIAHTGLQPLFRGTMSGEQEWWSPMLSLFQLGVYGVDIFFVLSGFLIATLLFNELKRRDKLDLPRFWLRRGLKIWPSYYVIYLLAAALSCASLLRNSGWGGVSEYWLRSWPNIFFLQNYLHLESRWFASWSLAIEEHFYLVLPVVLMLLVRSRFGIARLPLLCVFGFIVCTVLRGQAAEAGEFLELSKQTHFRADALLLGVLLAYIHAYKADVWGKLVRLRYLGVPLTVGCFMALYLYGADQVFIATWGYVLAYCAGAGLLVFFFGVDNARVQAAPLLNMLRFIGAYSYTIYLAQALGVHAYAIDRWSLGGSFQTWPLGAVGFWVISIGIGIICHHVVEQPMLMLRDRRISSRTGPVLLGVRKVQE